MKSRIAALLCLLAVIATSTIAEEGADAKKEKDKVDVTKLKCPMSGKACKESAVADLDGSKVYFCCPNCVKAFAKKEAQTKFATKVNHQLVATKQAKQVKCPLSGGKTKKAGCSISSGKKR